jgi:hypothetical protein
MNPARLYSVRMSPFQIRNRCATPMTSRIASLRSSSMPRRGFDASRSNWMAMPIPNSSENRAMAFNSTAIVRKVWTARSSVPVVFATGKNSSKIETRNSLTTLIASTPNKAMPRRISMALMRSPGLTGAEATATAPFATTSTMKSFQDSCSTESRSTELF